MPWNPDTYHQFREQRAAPFHDLLALIEPRPNSRAVDLGCGTGELTAQLQAYLPGSTVTGIDASPEMLERAAEHARPGLTFEQRDLRELNGPYDLIFSNAALQWVPDHHALFPQLWSHLAPGGQFAVQVPSNFGHPSHTLLAETAGEARFADALGGWRRDHAPGVLSIGEYAELLFRLGGTEMISMDRIYPVVLQDADGVLAWVSGTALVPYRERLPEDLWADFREAYRARLHAQWPTGPVFYAFKRTLLSTRKPA